jgi:hypothetical protein
MRYYCIAYPDELGNDVVETLSEEEIRKQYYPYWYDKMCAKYGEEHVKSNYVFEDCLTDWITIHWAWESTGEI